MWRKLPLAANQMGERFLHLMGYDPDDDILFVFGGHNPVAQSVPRSDAQLMLCSEGWWLDGGAENGSWTAYPPRGCYPVGTTVTIIPTGVTSYAFQQWDGDASGTTQPLEFIMDSNQAILAQFYTSSVDVGEEVLAFALEEIRPNPNPGPISIVYSLPRAAAVKLAVYDLAGRRVARLADGVVEAGRHTAIWNGRIDGAAANSGIYFMRFETPEGVFKRRVALLR